MMWSDVMRATPETDGGSRVMMAEVRLATMSESASHSAADTLMATVRSRRVSRTFGVSYG